MSPCKRLDDAGEQILYPHFTDEETENWPGNTGK